MLKDSEVGNIKLASNVRIMNKRLNENKHEIKEEKEKINDSYLNSDDESNNNSYKKLDAIKTEEDFIKETALMWCQNAVLIEALEQTEEDDLEFRKKITVLKETVKKRDLDHVEITKQEEEERKRKKTLHAEGIKSLIDMLKVAIMN